MIYEVNGKKPVVGKNCFVAPSASVIGDVTLSDGASVWFGATLRGDNDSIYVGENSNVQDGSVLHVDEDHPLRIDENVTIGHKVILHGCHIGAGTLVGMNAVVLNDAVVGKGCLIGANALVTEGMVIPDGSVVLGSPGKIVRDVSPETMQDILENATHYIEKSELYNETLKLVE